MLKKDKRNYVLLRELCKLVIFFGSWSRSNFFFKNSGHNKELKNEELFTIDVAGDTSGK